MTHYRTLNLMSSSINAIDIKHIGIESTANSHCLFMVNVGVPGIQFSNGFHFSSLSADRCLSNAKDSSGIFLCLMIEIKLP